MHQPLLITLSLGFFLLTQTHNMRNNSYTSIKFVKYKYTLNWNFFFFFFLTEKKIKNKKAQTRKKRSILQTFELWEDIAKAITV
jgi:hypothetical protein